LINVLFFYKKKINDSHSRYIIKDENKK